ncbi:hypothetical protein [Sphingomonas aurantiaca]|jgi:hypothetical protein|uniref:hypothetical protein n=1 Tax=Sphingomonas aurantiaca TaxID=185949 RepID=UPI003351DE75
MSVWKPGEPDRSSIEDFVVSFCREYKAWNNDAYAAYSRENVEQPADDYFSASYANLLRPFITPETRTQLPTFGSDPRFDPDRLTIRCVTPTNDGATVEFEIQSMVGEWADDFVADLTSKPVIAIRQIYYVDPYPDGDVDRLPYL